MPLEAPHRSRDRILLFGREGAGKTKATLDWARAIAPHPTWVISSDNTLDRLLETEYEDLAVCERYVDGVEDDSYLDPTGSLHVWEVNEWPFFRRAIETVWDRAKQDRDGLIVIDHLSWAWSEVRTWFVREMYGVDLDDWTLAYKQKVMGDGKKHSAEEAVFDDWSFINPQYLQLLAARLVTPPCHLVVLSHAKTLRSDGRVQKEVLDMFGDLGVAPEAQKATGRSMQTVIYAKADRAGYFLNNSVKDRGRERFERMEWDDFASDYLKDIAGWRTVGAKKKATRPKGKTRGTQ